MTRPKADPDLEAAVLGTVLAFPGAIKSAADSLRPEVFSREFNRHVFEACISLYKDGIDIDSKSVADRYLRLGKRDFPGIASSLATLELAALPTISSIPSHAVTLNDLYLRRQASLVYKKGLDDLDNFFKPINTILSASTEQLFALAADQNKGGVVALDQEALPEALRRLEAARRGDDDGSVVPYPWRSLTDLSPLRKGEVTVVCGRPGMAKTSFALNTALDTARAKIPVGIFSLEMNKATLATRLISMVSGVDSRLIEKGKTSDKQHQEVMEAVKELAKLPIHIDDNAEMDEMTFMNKSREAHQKHGVGLIILDYLTLMARSGENDVAAVGRCARTVRKTARILQIPIIEVCQVSRNCEYRDDKRPRLSDLRESGEIEQEADIVLALYRDEYYNKSTKQPWLAEVNVLKHRNGPLGQIELSFRKDTTRFYQMDYTSVESIETSIRNGLGRS